MRSVNGGMELKLGCAGVEALDDWLEFGDHFIALGLEGWGQHAIGSTHELSVDVKGFDLQPIIVTPISEKPRK